MHKYKLVGSQCKGFNSHMFNAPRFNSEKDVSVNFFTLNEAVLHWRVSKLVYTTISMVSKSRVFY
jgi:hypothetical protein